MIHLPDPDQYDDPIRYFRDSHGVVSSVLERLESLIADARIKTVSASFAATTEWEDLLEFFVHVAPVHEQDEETSLFPIVLSKVPNIGFQGHETPGRFIHEQHEVMQQRSIALLKLWRSFLALKQLSVEEEKQFLDTATALIALYREHIAEENKIIYSLANDELLSPIERIAIMTAIQQRHSDRVITPMLEFDRPIISDGSVEEENDSEATLDSAVSDQVLESEDEDDEEPDEEDE